MGRRRREWAHRAVRFVRTHRPKPGFSLRSWVLIIAMAVWMWLNSLDLMITYGGLGSGRAYEANRVMSGLMQHPVLAVSVKMLLAYGLLKLIERLERRVPFSGLAPLLAANVWLSWACLHNLYVVSGGEDWSHFLSLYPLTGPPG